VIPKVLRTGGAPLEEERLRSEVAAAVAGQVIPAHARLVRDVVFSGATTRDVEHGIGRAAAGYFPVNMRGSAATFYRTIMGEEVERAQVRLTSSAATTVDMVIW